MRKSVGKYQAFDIIQNAPKMEKSKTLTKYLENPCMLAENDPNMYNFNMLMVLFTLYTSAP